MNLLLDTHTFLWWMTADAQLSDKARDYISDPTNQIFVSAASSWEIAIKCSTGKMTLPESPQIYFPRSLAMEGFIELPITGKHTLFTYSLAFHHKDPFDRLLIAQSMIENMPIVSVDAAFVPYPVIIIW